MNGNGANGGDANSAGVSGYPATSTVDLAVVGWSANIGTTWAAADAWWNNGNPTATSVAEYFGISGVSGNVVLGATPGPYNVVWGPTAVSGLAMNEIIAVPEPATFALAGLGAAALVIFRRRKV